ncbi:MAG TPA: ABC transporter permease [Candidatus Choladousia intestinavium]|uniref:Autoinducer 2 import system permease protein LsrD n=1 Tax=Candidatus Choladousia intestinavium TaxID=2840727 RepID=A0A9D1AFF2_9FIRM|nr:ABC transporter permease [Candidatus Choladousia intestinavium]
MASNNKKKILGMEQDKFNMFMGKYGIGIILIGMVIIIAIMKPMFIRPGNLLNIFTQISINGLIAYGMCLAITTGGIDLTVGAQLALVSCILGQLVGVREWGYLPAGIVAVAVAGLFGFLNGVLISKFDMFPFVVTLSTQLIVRSIAQIISSGQAVSMADPAFKAIYAGKFGPIPRPIIYLAIVVVIMYIIMHWTRFGRYVYAVGGNVNAAIASGVSVFWTKTMCYTISGVLAGLAGIIFTSKTGSAQSNIGIGYETDAVAACVLGGTSFAGGISTAPGVLLGAIIIGCIYNGMNFLRIDSYYQSLAKGVVIIGAVLLDMVMNKKNR